MTSFNDFVKSVQLDIEERETKEAREEKKLAMAAKLNEKKEQLKGK